MKTRGSLRNAFPMGNGRWTLGLYNSYDPHHFHEAMRRAVSRAAPLCRAFEFNLAPIGFPFHAFKDKKGNVPERPTPTLLAELLATSTTIGEGGEYLVELAKEGRFNPIGFPDRGFPPQYGTPILATRKPDPKKRIDLRDVIFRTVAGESFLFVVGLGPRGVPKSVNAEAEFHLELTGGEFSLETATALGILVGRLWECLDHVRRPRGPALTVDAAVIRDDTILLVKRGREPFKGQWTLPGGFVSVGERVEDATLRELEEETSLKGTIDRLVGVYSDPSRDPRHHTVGVVYQVHAPNGPPKGGDDAAEAKFWPIDSPPPLAFDHGRILEDVRRLLYAKPQP
ncbi:MAG TPA: DUF531 family protein [Candidatus Thermoplasmatota archaeon]